MEEHLGELAYDYYSKRIFKETKEVYSFVKNWRYWHYEKWENYISAYQSKKDFDKEFDELFGSITEDLDYDQIRYEALTKV